MDKAVGHLFILDGSPYTNHRSRNTAFNPGMDLKSPCR